MRQIPEFFCQQIHIPVDFFGCYFSVNLSGRDFGVAKHFADAFQRDAFGQSQRGKCVAGEVKVLKLSSHAKLRSTIQCLGSGLNPVDLSDRKVIFI